MSLRSVIECELRGTEIPCKVCGHIPPDYCGRDDSPEAPAESTDSPEEDTGTDTTEGSEDAASEAPKVSKRKVKA